MAVRGKALTPISRMLCDASILSRPSATKPIIGRKGRHPHAFMRDAGHDDAAPAAGHAELCGFRLPTGNVELRPRKPV